MNKNKIMRDIINTLLTIIISYFIFGIIGIFISFIPDIMLIFIISDLWQKDPRDKLIGYKLKIHMFLHSVTFLHYIIKFIIFVFIVSSLYFMFIIDFNLYYFIYYFYSKQFYISVIILKVGLIFIIHIILDYITHKKGEGYFRGYNT